MAENWGNFKFADDRYIILRTIREYILTDSGKSWKKNPEEVKHEVINAENYTNYVQSIPWFNNWDHGAYCRGRRSYTCAGYLPTEIVTVAPYREKKIIAEFEFINCGKMKDEAGWREKEVMANAKEFERERYGSYPMYGTRLTLINPKDNGVTHAATWDTLKGRWVG